MRRVMNTVVGAAIALCASATIAAAQQAALGGSGPESVGGVVAMATPAVPAPWLQGDPADSIYKAARAALNRSQYKQAVELLDAGDPDAAGGCRNLSPVGRNYRSAGA